MSQAKKDVLQGTLTLLVLKVLEGGPKHGYAITRHIEQISEDALRIEEGSLYPALRRMEHAGWVRSEWAISESNRKARYYELTLTGKKMLADEQEDWRKLTAAVGRVLKFA
jgi:transcriptional regulator